MGLSYKDEMHEAQLIFCIDLRG